MEKKTLKNESRFYRLPTEASAQAGKEREEKTQRSQSLNAEGISLRTLREIPWRPLRLNCRRMAMIINQNTISEICEISLPARSRFGEGRRGK